MRTLLFPVGQITGYTVDDWLKLPEGGERIELIDGSFVISPLPTALHALCAGRLRTILGAAADPEGLVAVESVGVQVVEDGFLPDVAVLPRDVVMDRTDAFLASEVAVVAEIVSPGPGNRRRDYEIKTPKYAKAGIEVFIRVETEGIDSPHAEVLELGPHGYETVGQAKAGEVLTLTKPFSVSFDPAELFDA
ncbi:Uma2 family endonuclease [Nonomuraea helvata]|uniref:Uma2 family endonuclease n=1 Tax=Nonomuraea helvata TaxID=37484 RepID=A0ABV5S1V5_9ACTN